MKENLIIEIAIDRLISDLCLKYYLETDKAKREIIFNEIQKLYIDINKKN
jgi:hypothetical protein